MERFKDQLVHVISVQSVLHRQIVISPSLTTMTLLVKLVVLAPHLLPLTVLQPPRVAPHLQSAGRQDRHTLDGRSSLDDGAAFLPQLTDVSLGGVLEDQDKPSSATAFLFKQKGAHLCCVGLKRTYFQFYYDVGTAFSTLLWCLLQ